jgi:hypothetical protein
MGKRKITFAVAVALLLLFVLPTTTLAFADTGFIENDEINVAYSRESVSLRYWYEGSDYKQTFKLINIREYGSDGLSLFNLQIDQDKVDQWILTENTQSLFYEIDEFRDLNRYHITVEISLEFNHIELLLTVIRWDQAVEGSQLELTYTHNGGSYTVTLSDNWYFKRITVTSNDALNSEILSLDFLNFILNISNSVLLILLTTVTIILTVLTIAYRRKGRCE